MSEDFGLKEYLDEKFKNLDDNNAEIRKDISGIHQTMKEQNGRVGTLERSQARMDGSLATWKWIAGSGGLIGILTFAIVMLR